MVRQAITALILLTGLSGCATDHTLYDGWPAPGYVWDPQEGYVPSYTPANYSYGFSASYRSPHYRTGNPFYGRASYYDPYYCPPYLSAVRYGYGGPYGYFGRGYYGYGRVDPEKKRLKRERKQQKKALKQERKRQKKAFKQERKVQKQALKQERRALKQERKFQKRQMKQQRKVAKRQIKQQRKQAKRQRKRARR